MNSIVTAERTRRVSALILLVNATLFALSVGRGRFPFDALGTPVLPDFLAHLTGGKLVASGQRALLYDIGAQHAIEHAITGDGQVLNVFISPPLAAYLYAPLAPFSYGVAAALWTAISAALLAASAALILHMTPSLPRADRRLLLIGAAASEPFIQLLGTGNDTAISLLLWAAGIALALRGRDMASGVVFSLGLFKPQLFLLPPLVFLLLAKKRALLAWCAGAGAFAALTLALFGRAGALSWSALLHSPQYVEFLHGERAPRMASLVPLAHAALPATWAGAADAIGGALSAALVVATGYRIGFRKEPCRALAPRVDERGAWALACLANILASPHLFHYDLVLVVLPVALLLEVGITLSPRARGALLWSFILTWTAGVRAVLQPLAWPVSLLGASWAAVPLLVLWCAVPTRVAAPS